MKKIIAVAAILFAQTAMADGSGSQWNRPTVIAPQPQSWSGPYVGAGVAMSRTLERHTETVQDGYIRECQANTAIPHNGRKCRLTPEDWESEEIQALDYSAQPWVTHGSTPARFGNYAAWMGDQKALRFTSENSADIVLDDSGYAASNVLIGPNLVDIVSLVEAENLTGTVFAGYRHDMGFFVPGIEAGYNFETGGYGDLSLGADMGDVLPYVGYGTDGPIAGVDVRIGHRATVGIKRTFGDTEALEARVSFRF